LIKGVRSYLVEFRLKVKVDEDIKKSFKEDFCVAQVLSNKNQGSALNKVEMCYLYKK